MRWLRLVLALLHAKFRSRLDIHENSEKSFRVWLTDIDASIMNHAALMTVLKSGKIDFMVRTGFFKLARQKKWFFPSTSIHIQFFRPLKAFQKAIMCTRVLNVSEYSIYMEQKISKNGKDIALCIVKSKVKSGKENISTQEIIRLLGAHSISAEQLHFNEQLERHEELLKNTLYSKS